MIGEGGAKEWTQDILVVAHLEKISGKTSDTNIAIKVWDHNTKKVLLQRSKAEVSFAETKKAAKAFTLENIQCTNLDITVSADKTSQSINLPFACGE